MRVCIFNRLQAASSHRPASVLRAVPPSLPAGRKNIQLRNAFPQVHGQGPASSTANHWRFGRHHPCGNRNQTPNLSAQVFEGSDPVNCQPLAHWTFADCFAYLEAHGVPAHPLHARVNLSDWLAAAAAATTCTRLLLDLAMQAELANPCCMAWWSGLVNMILHDTPHGVTCTAIK